MGPPAQQQSIRHDEQQPSSEAAALDGRETPIANLADARGGPQDWLGLLQASGHPIAVASAAGITFMNAAARRLLGDDAPDIGLRPFETLLPDRVAPVLRQSVLEMLSDEGAASAVELNVESAWGGSRILAFRLSTTQWSGAPAVLMDIEDRSEAHSLRARAESTERRYRTLARDGSEWYWETDTQHRFVHCSFNVANDDLRGERSGLLGSTRIECAEPDQDPQIWARHQRDLDAHRPFDNLIYRPLRSLSDGAREWVKVKGAPRYDRNGQFLGYAGIGTDISEEVNSRQEAEQLETTLMEVIQSLPVAFALFDADERLQLFNDRYRSAHGSEFEPILNVGTTFSEIIDHHLARGHLPEAVGNEKEWRKQRLEQFRRGGTSRAVQRVGGWHQVNDCRLANGSTVIICTEIGDLMDQERALEQARQRLADYAAAASDWFWETDKDHRVTFVSDRLTEATGIPTHGFLGRIRSEFPSADISADVLEAHLDDLAHRRPFRELQYAISAPDGRRLHVSINGVPIFSEDGTFTGYRGTGIDVTEATLAQAAQERFIEAIENITDGYSLWNNNDELVVFNSVWTDFVKDGTSLDLKPGLAYETLLRDSIKHGAFPSATSNPEAWLVERLRRHRHDERPFEIERSQGRWYLVRERKTPEGGTLQTVSDITALKRRENALRDSEERFKNFAESAADWFWEIDARFCFTFISSRFEQVTGLSSASMMGQPFEALAADRDSGTRPLSKALKTLHAGNPVQDVEFYAAADGRSVSVQSLSGAPVLNRACDIVGYRGTCRDVTQARLMSMQLAYQASHDELTGLVNRRGFERRLTQSQDSLIHGQTQHAMCYLDLDQFKVVNDTCGHAAGDELLKQLANLLQEHVRGGDAVARLGGDEFAVLLQNCALDEARGVAEELRTAIEQFEFLWEDKRFRLGASLGVVAIHPSTAVSDMMREVDSACYFAKEQGRNRVYVHDPDDLELTHRQDQLNWVARLNKALVEDQFVLFGQSIRPCVSTEATPAHHLEILIRLKDDDGSLIAPGSFLPAAERYGLATRIDRWVVQQCFDLLRRSSDELLSGGFISINLSGQSLSDRDFCDFVLTQLDDPDVNGSNVCFEVTETAAIADIRAAEHFIETTREHGCKFALDDFGTGLSSFAYLRDLAVDFVKIDGAFIKDIENDPISLAMVRSIQQVAHVLGKRTIAEYVSSDRAIEMLADVGVDYVQGFGVGRPAPLDTLISIT